MENEDEPREIENRKKQQHAAQETMARLRSEYHTGSLATVNSAGQPQASYVPLALDGSSSLLFFVSELSEHTENLKTSGRASLMLIDDEGRSPQLFARDRVTFNGAVLEVPRESPEWEHAARVYGERYGKFFQMLATFKDFHMFRLIPEEVRLVVGFGGAYRVEGPDWETFTLLAGR